MDHMLPLQSPDVETFISELVIQYCTSAKAIPVHQARLQLASFKGALDILIKDRRVREIERKTFSGDARI